MSKREQTNVESKENLLGRKSSNKLCAKQKRGGKNGENKEHGDAGYRSRVQK